MQPGFCRLLQQIAPGPGLCCKLFHRDAVVERVLGRQQGDEHPHTATVSSVDGPVDYRYLLANERTFLAYLRTALSLQVAGLGVLQFLTHGSDAVRYES